MEKANLARYLIRNLRPAEYPLLADFLYMAIFVPPGQQPPPREVLALPDMQVYIQDFGRGTGDRAVAAEAAGRLVGAAWARIVEDYGHVDDDTPSLAVAVEAPYRGQGIGGALLRALLDQLAQAGYRRASLSVQKENPAVALYRRLGFQTLRETESEYIMVNTLAR